MDVALFEAGSAKGKTDGDGAYRFDLKLPEYFAGRAAQPGRGARAGRGHGEGLGGPCGNARRAGHGEPSRR